MKGNKTKIAVILLFVNVIAALVFMISCRKKVDRKDSLNYPLATSTTGAQALTPSCTIADNKIHMGVSTTTVTNPSYSVSSSVYTFIGNSSYGNITITINQTPDISKSYTIDGSNFTANVNSLSKGSMDASYGTLYFNYISGKYSVTLCGGSFYSYVTLNNYIIDCNIN